MKKWYGNAINRIQEGHQFVDEIKVGDGVTMYFYSDRHAYEITKVIDQKHFFMREYEHECVGGAYSNEWKLISKESNPEYEIVWNRNSWKEVRRFTKEAMEKAVANMKDCVNPESNYAVYRYYNRLTDKDIEKLNAGKEVVKYFKIQPISIGVADYYYDYEF